MILHALRRVASLRLTLVGILAALALLVWSRYEDVPVGPWIAAPFALLMLNLLGALCVSPRLQRQGGLLVMHLGLAMLAGLGAYGALVGLSGHVEVTEGVAFDARLVAAVTGPWHENRLERVRFVQGEFTINYAPGMKRRETASRIAVPAAGGTTWHEVGDDRPLVVDGYRFYTSFNKGFAPLLTVAGGAGVAQGAVHLPSYPLHDWKQGTEWTPPGATRAVKLWLDMPEPVLVADAVWTFRKPRDPLLVVIDGARRVELRAGESTVVDGQTLRFDELRSWMGYTISYDPTPPWLVAAAVIAVLGLLWHIIGMMRRSPWQGGRGAGEAV